MFLAKGMIGLVVGRESRAGAGRQTDSSSADAEADRQAGRVVVATLHYDNYNKRNKRKPSSYSYSTANISYIRYSTYTVPNAKLLFGLSVRLDVRLDYQMYQMSSVV